jgi:hypothetical protein
VAVRVLTLPLVVAEVVAGGECVFYGYFVHETPISVECVYCTVSGLERHVIRMPVAVRLPGVFACIPELQSPTVETGITGKIGRNFASCIVPFGFPHFGGDLQLQIPRVARDDNSGINGNRIQERT